MHSLHSLSHSLPCLPACRRCLPAVYRSAFAEDLDEVGERKMAEEGGFRHLRLSRLT